MTLDEIKGAIGIEPYFEEDCGVVYCADCLEILPKIPDKSVDLVLTDPPYGVSWCSNRRMVKHQLIENDKKTDWIKPSYLELFRILNNDSLCFTFYGWPQCDIFMSTFKDVGFRPKSHFSFIKNNIGLGWFSRGQHEVAFLLAKGSPRKPKNAISDVVYWDNTGNELHPTQKPTEPISRIINCYSSNSNLILDPFLGSGTTAVAAKQLGRKYIGIEISEKYCDIAVQRLAQGVLI